MHLGTSQFLEGKIHAERYPDKRIGKRQNGFINQLTIGIAQLHVMADVDVRQIELRNNPIPIKNTATGTTVIVTIGIDRGPRTPIKVNTSRCPVSIAQIGSDFRTTAVIFCRMISPSAIGVISKMANVRLSFSRAIVPAASMVIRIRPSNMTIP